MAAPTLPPLFRQPREKSKEYLEAQCFCTLLTLAASTRPLIRTDSADATFSHPFCSTPDVNVAVLRAPSGSYEYLANYSHPAHTHF